MPSGTNMRRAIDQLIQGGKPLTNELTDALYRKYIDDRDPASVDTWRGELNRIAHEISTWATESSRETTAFDTALIASNERLQGKVDTPTLEEIVRHLRENIRGMQQVVSTLRGQIDNNTRELESLRQELQRTREEAWTDALTGLLNRKGFEHALTGALRESLPLSLLLLDLDHFKSINDNHGHLLGDKVLRTVGQLLKLSLKGNDVVARFGGEEFIILLSNTPVAGARAVAEQLRTAIAKCRIRQFDRDEAIDAITVSIGGALYIAGESSEKFISRADAELYRCKREGRNRVSIAETA